MDAIRKLTRLSTIIAFSLAALISVGLPAGYFVLGYQNQRAVTRTEAYMNSIFLSEAISESPEHWKYEEHRLSEVLSHHTSRLYNELRSVVAADNTVVARSGDTVAPPFLKVSHKLYDSGNVVGRVEITTSLGPLLKNTILAAILGLFLGTLVFVALKLFPLHALSTALRSLYEEKEKAQAILNNIPDIAWLKDREGRYIAANGPFFKTCGVAPDKLPGMTDLELWPRDLAEKYRLDDREVMESGSPKQIEELIIDTDGRRTWLSTIKTPIFNERGEVIGTTGIGRDLTDRKLMENTLKEREEKLRSLTNIAQDAIVMMDHEGNISFWNPAAEKIFGYSSSEALGKEMHTFLAPERYYENYRKGLSHFRETGQGMAVGKTLELDAVRKGGEEFPMELSLSALQIQGKWHAVGIIRDITERKRVEEALRESEERYRSVVDNVGIGIALISPNMEILSLNRQMKIWSPAIDESQRPICFRSFNSPPREEICSYCPTAKTLKDGLIHESITETPTESGIINYRVVSSPLKDSEGNVIAAIELVEDVTVRKRAEAEIKRLNDELEQKVQERTEQLVNAQEELVRNEKLSILGQLAGSVGHELRNPLGVMNNAIYFLKTVLPQSDETVREYLNMIKSEIDNSERIITDLLDFSRTKTPQIRSITVDELLSTSMGKCSLPENVKIETDIPDTLPLLRVDPFQITQVFQNLITNACQAMPEGGELRISARITGVRDLGLGIEKAGVRGLDLGVSKEGIGDQGLGIGRENLNPIPQTPTPDRNFIEITVADTGEGISPENMNRIFQPLFTTKAKGIGLGLVVSRRLTEVNGGSIEVNSVAGKGTTFTVMLPAEGKEK